MGEDTQERDPNEVEKEGLKLMYFVLNPRKDNPYGAASRKAMSAYADSIQDHNPTLADDLRVWVYQEESHILDMKGEG